MSCDPKPAPVPGQQGPGTHDAAGSVYRASLAAAGDRYAELSGRDLDATTGPAAAWPTAPGRLARRPPTPGSRAPWQWPSGKVNLHRVRQQAFSTCRLCTTREW
jgi:hypothetical protein